MANFPVESNDIESIVSALNTLLSGPSGLGQNFAGFSSSDTGYLTGNFRVPYTVTEPPPLYVPNIDLSRAEMIDGRTFKFTFATEQSSPPFVAGNNPATKGIVNDFYNDTWSPIGVVECTTTYVILRVNTTYDVIGPSSGGYIYNRTGTGDLSTDANARVTVSGATDRVFIAAQLDNLITYFCDSGSTLSYTVSINRYKAFPNNDPTNPDYYFNYDDTVVTKTYTLSNLSSGTTDLIETVFTTVLDQPTIGYYWYILEIAFDFTTGSGEVTESKFGLRGLSAQVVKQ